VWYGFEPGSVGSHFYNSDIAWSGSMLVYIALASVVNRNAPAGNGLIF
jgi:hypothetical protein